MRWLRGGEPDSTSPSSTSPLEQRWLMSYRGHSVFSTLIRAKFSPVHTTGERYIVSGSEDGLVYVYDVLSGQLVSRISGHTDVVRDVAWHPYQPMILSSSWDGTIGCMEPVQDGRPNVPAAPTASDQRPRGTAAFRGGIPIRFHQFAAALARRQGDAPDDDDDDDDDDAGRGNDEDEDEDEDDAEDGGSGGSEHDDDVDGATVWHTHAGDEDSGEDSESSNVVIDSLHAGPADDHGSPGSEDGL